MGQIEAAPLIFLLQALLLSIYIPLSYIGYKKIRAPLKNKQIKKDLELLDEDTDEDTEAIDEFLKDGYELRHYFWPLLFAFALTFGMYTLTHPYSIENGWWFGILEETIDIFGPASPVSKPVAAGRFLFWGWMGAYIYSVHLTFRRFMAYDLTPNVYIFTSNRFFLAMTVGAIVGVGVGTFITKTGLSSFDTSMAMVSIVTFTIGFFPEKGISWLTTTASKIMKIKWEPMNKNPLSEIDGLNIWQEGRLNQEGIESVQNLATANLRALVIDTPFTIHQIVDWIDQAILQVYVDKDQLEELKTVGLRCASAVLKATDEKHLEHLVKALNKEDSDKVSINRDGLSMLHLAIQSAPNIKPVSHFWQKTNKGLSDQQKSKSTPLSSPQELDQVNNKQAESISNKTAPDPEIIPSESLNNAIPKVSSQPDHHSSSSIDKVKNVQYQTESFWLQKQVIFNDNLVGERLGKYHLNELIAQNGLITIYRGIDVSKQRTIILKTIKLSHTNLNYKKYFVSKIKHIAQINHPHIAKLDEYGQAGELLCLVMQYIEGDNLASILTSYQKNKVHIPPQFACQIIKQIGGALDYAHSKGINHCNVNPSNIILNHKKEAYLIDFALLPNIEQNSLNKLMSNLYYIAPEQIHSFVDANPQSDLYSLGIILYEMLTSAVPFDDPSPIAIALQHITTPPPPLLKMNPHLNSKIEQVLLNALSKSPNDRYKTGHDLYNAAVKALGEIDDKQAVEPLGERLQGKNAVAHPAETEMLEGNKWKVESLFERLPE